MRLLLCSTLTLLSCSAAGVLAQAADPCATAPQTCATLINTHASADARLANTAVDISAGILASGRDLPSVQRALAEKSAALLSYLRAGKAQRLATMSVSFAPETRSQKNGPDKTVGYTATSQVSFRTTPERSPELLSGVLDHGANSIDATNFTPTEDEVAAARASLSAEATRVAIAQGEAIAKAAGMHLVSVRTIDVEADATYAPRQMAYPAAAMRVRVASAPIETAAGDRSISMRVDVTIAAAR